MTRNYKIRRYREIVAALRARCPSIAVSTDIIVGFPTETEEDFQQTMALVEEVGYHNVFSFCYSRRPNTPAEHGYRAEEEVPPAVSRSRLERLQRRQDEIGLELNRRLAGTVVEVLVERRSKHISSAMKGRNPHNTLVEVLGPAEAGEIVPVRIEAASPHCLRGVVIREEEARAAAGNSR
jgi:tRNA-2-methylthio-N6-dimethylallyladenosine synthase